MTTPTATATRPATTPLGRRTSALAERCRDNPEDQEAWGELFASMRFFVARAVNRHLRHNTAYDEADLWQEGYSGVVRAVEDYDPARGEFSTYVEGWIRQRITRFRSLVSYPIHVPIHVQTRRNQWLWAGRPHDPEMERLDLNCVRTASIRHPVPQAQDGDEPDVDAWNPGEFCVVPIHCDPAEAIDPPRLVLRLKRAVDELARTRPRDAEVFCRYHGLFGREQRNMTEIAKDLDMTRQRVQQLHTRAMARVVYLMTEVAEAAA